MTLFSFCVRGDTLSKTGVIKLALENAQLLVPETLGGGTIPDSRVGA